ncbi:MAG: HIT family protein [Bacillota bacterium]
MSTPDCPFCRRGPDVGHVLFENGLCVCLLREEPVLEGSAVIVPKAHREMVFDLTPGEWSATFELLKRFKEWADTESRPDGFNVGWNSGTVAGQDIPHAHLHVIPRFADEPLAGKGIRYWFKSEANRRPASADR